MIRQDNAESAADEFLSAAILGDDWEFALQQLSDATDAGGATLMRLRRGRPVGTLSSTDWLEADTAMLAGGAPASERRFFPDHVFAGGFLGDTDVWTDEDLQRDAYFQEFLRPRGVFYHAKARLLADGDDRISLSLKHLMKLGRYKAPEIAMLDRLLPKLRMAVRVASRVFDAEASGMMRSLQFRGDPVFELDTSGRVLRSHGEADRHGVAARQKHLCVIDWHAQMLLDRAVARAAIAPRQPALVSLTDPLGERIFIQLVPVTGRARDVFCATAAVAVVLDPARGAGAPLPVTVRQIFDLTEREAQLAALLSEGISLSAASQRLRLGVGTVRNHLKSVFGKTGTRRQGELIALLRTLQR